MKDIERFLRHQPHTLPRYYDDAPTCRQFEPNFEKIANEARINEDGSMRLSDGTTVGQLFKGRLFDPEPWILEESVQIGLVLVKNPNRNNFVFDNYGIRNGLIHVEEYVFTTSVKEKGFTLIRPVQKSYQQLLKELYDRVSRIANVDQVPIWTSDFYRSTLPSKSVVL